MKLLVQSAMIFFGTLMAAGFVALGAPDASRGEGIASHQGPSLHALNQVVNFARPWIVATFAQGGR